MKKAITLLFVLGMVLTLTGCKNKAVKNVEELINAIGEVTLDSGESITAARTAYDALTEKEVAKVENDTLLTKAEATLTALEEEQARLEAEQAEFEAVCEWLVGDWTYLYSFVEGNWNTDNFLENGISFKKDGTGSSAGMTFTWTYTDDAIIIGLEGFSIEFSIAETNGIYSLRGGDSQLIPIKDVDKIFEFVEITSENISDYVEIVEMPFEKLDDFGSVEEAGMVAWASSKVYNDFIYLSANQEAVFEAVCGDEQRTRNHLYGPMWFPPHWCPKVADISHGRAMGTACFARVEYVNVSVIDGIRNVEILGCPMNSHRLNYFGTEGFHYMENEHLFY